MNAAHTDSPAVNPWLVAVVVSLATFMEVLDTTITNVSLTHIAGSLAASQDESTWVLTSYLVANGIVLPLSGWLSDVMGRKRFFMLCIASFTAASFVCGAATSLGMLVVFRLVQGLAGGGLQPTQQAIILDAFPPEKRGQVFAITGITLIAAPIIGPTLGGYITDNVSWRWIFFLNVPVGIIALLLVNRLVQDVHTLKREGKLSIDYIGLGLVALGLGSLQIMLDKGQQDDWFESSFIITMAILGFGALAAAVAWLLKQKDPIVDLRLLAEPSFGMACVLIFFTGFALYGSSALLPILVQSQFGYDATLAGLILSPGGFAVVFLMPLVGKLVGRVQARRLVPIGLTLCGLGMYFTYHVTPQTDYHTFVMMRILQVAGLPFLFIPISSLAYMHIPQHKNNKASALYSLFRNLGGSIGIAIIASYVARHQQMHQSALASNLAPTDLRYQSSLAQYQQAIEGTGQTAASAAQQASGQLYREMLHQASVLAYSDAFMFMASIMGILAVLAFFLLPANRPGNAGAAAAH